MNTITPAQNHAIRLRKARTTLLLDHPFIGTLLFRLCAWPKPRSRLSPPTGVTLYYNPTFVDTLTASELEGTLAHEVMHPALQHHTRRGGRDARRWNMACDYAINPLLIEAGLTLPDDVLLDYRFRGMSAEEIYNQLDARIRTNRTPILALTSSPLPVVRFTSSSSSSYLDWAG